MSFVYSDILNDIDTRSHNKRASITNVRSLINSSARQAWLDIDFHDSIRRSQTVYTAYDKVYYFPLPSDLKGESIITIEQVKNKLGASNANPEKQILYKFDSNFPSNDFVIDYHEGQKWLKWNAQINNSSKTIHKLNDIDENGTWTVADDGTNIKENEQNWLIRSASMSCDITALGTTLSIENVKLTNSIDLSDEEDTGSFFIWVYLPTITNLTSITLYWGSSTTAYWYNSTTTPFDRTSFKLGWNLMQVNWSNATKNNSPVSSAIDYVKVSLDFSATPDVLTGYLFNNYFYNLGNSYELSYYSSCPWKTTEGTFIKKSVLNNDILNVDEEGYEVIMDKIMENVAQAIPLSTDNLTLFKNNYLMSKKRYTFKYPSRRKKLITQYYQT